MAEDPPPPPKPPSLTRSVSEGGIPMYQGSDITVIEKAKLNFDGLAPSQNKVWLGATTFELADEKWTIDSFLNHGGAGQTYSLTQVSTGKKFAAKFLKDADCKEVELVRKMPRQLVQHPNFIKYEMIVLNVKEHFPFCAHIIFMEHVPNGELFDFIASPEPAVAGKPVSEGTSRRFLHDVISGMAECYRCGVTHRDLKPENLLINEDGRIVIIDMDHAKRVKPVAQAPATDGAPPPPVPLEKTTTVNPYGTPAFNAPEVSSGRKYVCEASDVWSVGVIAFYLHAKLPAFTQGGGVGSWADVSGTENTLFWSKIEKSGYYTLFPPDLKKFINTLWRKDPTERPSFRQLEDAIQGSAETLQAFPGLQWLADATNDQAEFVAELRRTRPNIKLREEKTLPKTDDTSNIEARRW
mmetsp:Transcript_55359/g.132063  ORF Transcript_55359/g.132063 Transcript_55359/m.132063 type:complete len:410 (-) Transcript_55359:5-1234(-)